MVDWSDITSSADWMNFHKEEIKIDSNPLIESSLKEAYGFVPPITLLKKFKFTEV